MYTTGHTSEDTMAFAEMSLSTPTAGVQALRLGNERPAASSRREEVPDSDGRNWRRVTPTNLVVTSTIGSLQTGAAGSSRTPDTASSAQPGTWDYLAKWETGDSSIVEDIEEEEYYSDVSDESAGSLEDADQEGEEGEYIPPGGPATRPSRLGEARVTEIINDCIEMYANAWRPGKGETKPRDEEGQIEIPVVYDALALWEEAQAAGKREELAKKYELEAEYYRQRLDKLCEEISKDPGDTEAAIKIKCRNLEVTVELLERATWFEGIYKLLPVASSDDESQDEDARVLNQTPLSILQPSDHTQQLRLPSQVVDLGTPSSSESSEAEGVPLNDISTTALQIGIPDKRGCVTEPRPFSSDPFVLFTIENPATAVVASTPSNARSQAPLGDAPEHASIATISRWSWAQLEETQDRKRVVSRAIYEMSSIEREVMRQRLQKVGRTNMIREIPACVDMLWRGDERMPGILPQDLPKIIIFTKLFLCWWLCGNYIQKEPSELELEELAGCLRQHSPDPSTFCDYVDTVLSTSFSLEALNKPTQPSQAEIIEISDDDDNDEPPTQVINRRRANVDKPGSMYKRDPIVLD